jgi:uncharacterized protein YqhQ
VSDPALRVGGMACGNGVFMRGPRFWALARADGTLLEGPVRSLLPRHRWLRLPLLRSAIALVEMLAMTILLHRRNGVRPAASLLAWLALAMLCSLGFSVVLPALIHGTLLAGALLEVLSFALALLALRQGLGEAVWRYHGAEHKAVNAYEAGADLCDPEAVMAHSRIHDRCGTNLVTFIVVLLIAGYLPLGGRPLADQLGGLYSVLVLVLALELFRLVGRWPRAPLSRVALAGGRTLQRCLTTREPAPLHLEPACTALRRVLELEGAAPSRPPAAVTPPRPEGEPVSGLGCTGRAS